MILLIAVVLLIFFSIFGYFFLKSKIKRFLGQFGFGSIKEAIEEARLEDQEVPKSLSSMDSIYLKQVKTDFPDINISELKRKAEKEILDCFHSIELKDASNLTGKMKSSVLKIMEDYQGKDVSFQQFIFHNTVLSNYHKNGEVATITFSSAFEYYLVEDGKSVKTQDRARVEFIYIIDEEKISPEENVLGIHCPNCGSPIKTLGEKQCSYCGSAVMEIVGRVFVCNDIVRY